MPLPGLKDHRPIHPLQTMAPSMSQAGLVAHARLQASHRDEQMSGQVAGDRLLAEFLQNGQAVVKDLGTI